MLFVVDRAPVRCNSRDRPVRVQVDVPLAMAATLRHGYKIHPRLSTSLSPQPPSSPKIHPWPPYRSARPRAWRIMSGVAGTFVRVSPPIGRRRKAGILNDELRARRHGGDFSHLAPIIPESDRSPSLVPDYDKDLPRIPSTSTGLWGDEVVTVSTEMMGSPTASPTVGCPPSLAPSRQVHERVLITEAQHIATQYQQRYHTSSESTTAPEQTAQNVSTNPLDCYMPLPRAL